MHNELKKRRQSYEKWHITVAIVIKKRLSLQTLSRTVAAWLENYFLTIINLPGGKFDTDRTFALQIEFIPSKPRQ